jgi:hypothetical protein
VAETSSVPTPSAGTPGDDATISPDRVLLAELHHLLAAARRQQTVLRESLTTVIAFLESTRPG